MVRLTTQTTVVEVATAAMDKVVIEILMNREITPPHQTLQEANSTMNSSNRETKPLLKRLLTMPLQWLPLEQ